MGRLLLFVSFFLFSFYTWGQERTVTGKVTSADDGSALPGVNVVLKGTSTGTVTDIDGNYSIDVPSDGGTLVFSFVGLETQEIDIGTRSVIDVRLASDVTQLSEVVVTAMNISREKASLGYAQQTLEGDAVNRVKQSNFINSLSGKVAGVEIRSNNTMGGSTNITIRGNSSFSNNAPLFVIDGVPVSNETNNAATQNSGRYGYDYGNPAADINPEDIASMSVLKGAAATALYGSRGQNGVILITTKKGVGRKGIGVSLSSSVSVGTIDKDTFIEYQDQYGAGYGPFYTNPDLAVDNPYFHDVDIDGDGQLDFVVPTTEDASYGAAFDPNLEVYHWDSFVPESPNFMRKRPWVAAENTPVDFFETQVILNNSIALSGGNESTTFRLSYSNLSQDDILPNSQLNKNTVNFTGATDLTENLRADVLFQYSTQDVVGRFSTGYSDNLMSQFRQWWQTNVDIKALEDIYRSTGKNYTWNPADFTDPTTPIYWDNPYWTRYENYNSDNRDRILSKVSVQYKFNDWLRLTGRASVDTYNETREERRAVGSVPGEFGVPLADGVTRVDESSGYQRVLIESSEYNFDGLLTADRDLSEDLTLYALLGFNLRRENYEFVQESTRGGLAVPGLYALSNSVSPNPFPNEFLHEKEVYGYFGNVNLGFRNFLYLDANYRIDISSALPVDNNQYDYYAVGLGLIFSELVDIDWMDFGKVRASYGTVGNDTDPLQVFPVYARGPNFGNGILTTVPTSRPNENLKAERTEEYEFGLQVNAFDQRLNFDIAYYNRETSDQLLSVQVSKATGYNSTFLNAGTIENKGIELVLGGDIIKAGDWRWNANINFTRNRSEVLELLGDVQNYLFNSYQGGVSSNATVGEPFGIFRGTGFEYVNGEKVIEQTGLYAGMYRAVADQIIGDPNPDWNMGINNLLTYKGITLGFLVDVQHGGDVFSLDMHYGQGTGVTENTAGNNHLGNPKRDPVAEGGGVLNEGVSESGEPNTVVATADYFAGNYYWGDQDINPNALTIYDASYIKLREASITYTLPSQLIESFAHRVDISLVGRNLWIIDKNLPFADPESGLGVGPAQGYLSGSYPTVRSMGFKLDVEF